MRVHMLATDLINTLCPNPGNWEGRTIEAANVSCPACEALLPKPEPVKLYTMVLRSRTTGREEELYGHVTENVVQQYACANLDNPRFDGNDWEMVIRPYVAHTCDWSKCPGEHANEEQYCSMTRRMDDE